MKGGEKMKINKTLIISAFLIVIALGGGFLAGTAYQKGKAVVRNAMYSFGQSGQARDSFGRPTGQNFRPVRGEVMSLDKNSITVKLPNGNSEIVIFGPSTQFAQVSTASASDVKTGNTVMVVGVHNSDGSVTASDVQINPLSLRVPSPIK